MAKPKLPGKTVARGYGAPHVTERQRWQDRLDRGAELQCTCRHPDCPHHITERCPVVIRRGDRWDLAHNDDRTGWIGVQCELCNRAEGGRRGRASQTDPMTIRGWCQPRH